MGLLDRLKRALGIGGGGSERDASDRDTGGVRVEREPDASTEAAVKGTDDEPVAAGTDAAGSTGSITETPPETPGDDDVSEAAEPAEAAGPVSQTETGAPGETDEAQETQDAETADAAEPDATGDEGEESGETDETDETDDDRPVREITGIGPAYERRLNETGIETVGDLAAADAAALAEATDVAEGRVANWIDRARGGGG